MLSAAIEGWKFLETAGRNIMDTMSQKEKFVRGEIKDLRTFSAFTTDNAKAVIKKLAGEVDASMAKQVVAEGKEPAKNPAPLYTTLVDEAIAEGDSSLAR